MTHPPGTICIVSNELSRYPAFAMSVLGTTVPHGTKIIWHTGNAIAANRNACIREMHGEWVWFIDDDHIWEAGLLMALLDHEVEIVGPIYAMRYHPFPPSVFSGRSRDGQRYLSLSWDELAQPGGLRPVGAIGGAGMLIRKRVFEVVADPWFEVGRIDPEGLWEDAWFCEKAVRAGVPVHADVTQRMGHICRLVLWPTETGVAADIAESGLRLPVPTLEMSHAT